MQGISMGLRVRRDSDERMRLVALAADRVNALLAGGGGPEQRESGEDGDLRWSVEPDPSLAADGGERTDAPVPLRITVEAPSGRTWEVVTLMTAAEEEK